MINFGCLAEHINSSAYCCQQSSFVPFFLSHSLGLLLTPLIRQISCAIFYYYFTALYFSKNLILFVSLSAVKGKEANSHPISHFV